MITFTGKLLPDRIIFTREKTYRSFSNEGMWLDKIYYMQPPEQWLQPGGSGHESNAPQLNSCASKI